MSNNYKESSIAGTSWVRAREVSISNQYMSTPSISILEEKVISVEGDIVKKDVGYLTQAFDPNSLVSVIDPVTNIDTGAKVTHEYIYSMLYSLYMSMAKQRDIREGLIPAESTPNLFSNT